MCEERESIYKHAIFMIGEKLVRYSKYELSANQTITEIRKELIQLNHNLEREECQNA